MTPLRPVGTPTSIVGRGAEQAQLLAAIAEASSGSPVLVLAAGPPGVGTSRLLREALREAGDDGFVTLAGTADPLRRRSAYAPLVTAFGAHLRTLGEGDLRGTVGDLPQLGLLFGGLGLEAPAPFGDPALDAARLQHGLVELTQRLMRDSPVALLIEDAREADDATLAYLAHLTSTVSDGPLLILLTARPDEPGRSELSELRASLPHPGWRWIDIDVGPLSDEDSVILVTSIIGDRPDVAADVVRRCGGRPLFLEEVATLIADGTADHGAADHEAAIPEGIRAQLLTRAARVGPAERTVLDLLAIAGGDVPLAVITAATDAPGDDVASALDSLYRRGLVRADTSDASYDLAHGLLADALLSAMSPPARTRWHARLAAAYVSLRADDPRLPEHVLAAGPLLDPRLTRDELIRGARRAARLGDSGTAARFLAAAVDAARRNGGDGMEASIADLERERGDALRRSGQPRQAKAAWEAALDEYLRSHQPEKVASVQQDLGMIHWSEGDFDGARTRFEAAEEALHDTPASPVHAAMLHQRAMTASRIGDVDILSRSAMLLRQVAAELDMPAVDARRHLTDALVAFSRADFAEMVAQDNLALQAARAADDTSLMIRAHDQLSVAAGCLLDVPMLREHSAASLELARSLGARILEPWPRLRLAVADLLAGDWDRALRTTSDLITMPDRYGERRGALSAYGLHALVLAQQGRLADARRYLDRAHEIAHPVLRTDHNVYSVVAIADAWMALDDGRPEDAIALADDLETATGGWLWLWARTMLGLAYARAGRADAARAIARRIREVRATSTAPQTLSTWLAGSVHAANGDRAEAATAFAAAREGLEVLGLPFLAASVDLAVLEMALGETAGARPRHAAAVDAGRRALATFERLGAPTHAQRARAGLRRHGVSPPRRARGEGRAEGRGVVGAGTAAGSLSPRELEVARHVASGRTNAEVAAALFISPRTVTTHLEHIYARLELTSRVALTRYLADSGLLETVDG